MRHRTRPAGLDDEALAQLVGEGDAAAFELLYDRHHRALLAFCRHMLGNREDGEDALQQAFVRAHRTLSEGRAPDAVRPWLFAIARNRCLTMLGARRDAAVAVEDIELSFDGLDADVERRSDLRELLTDLSQLPDDQRGALVLAELGDFNHAEIAAVIGCPAPKVKALVFQARASLIADRDARRTPCDVIRTQLETARGGVLRRGALRRHLRLCDPCAAYRHAMEGRRSGLAILLPVAPTAGLKAGVLAGAGGLGGGAESAAAAALLGSSGLGAAASGVATTGAGVAGGGVATAGAVAGGVAVKALAAKVAVAVAVGAGAAGGGVAAVQDGAREAPVRQAVAERAGAFVSAPPSRGAPPAASPGAAAAAASATAAAAQTLPAASTQAGGRQRLRRVAARRLRAADGAQRRRLRQRIRRHRRRAGGAIQRKRRRAAAEAPLVVGEARPARWRRRRDPGVAAPVTTATPSPTASPVPTPPPRTRRRPVQSPTPAPTPRPRRPSPPADAPTPKPKPKRPSPPADAPTPVPTPKPKRPSPPAEAPTPAPTPRPRRPRPPEATPAPAPPAATPAATPTPDP